jgi:hypothetical protein
MKLVTIKYSGYKLFNCLIVSFFIFALAMTSIFSYPFTTRPDSCDTSSQYDSDTKATVYGDSRMDYMGGVPGFPLYDLDVYLQYPSARAWNVQNFGLNGESSTGLEAHLRKCLSNTPPTTTTSTGNYKIHENVAFHIGGNDFVNNIGVLFLYPWKQKEYVNYARYNNERIVVMLLKKRRNVLLTGHYPALSISKDPVFNTLDLGPNNKAVLDNITKAYTNPNYAMNSSLINSKVNRCSGKEALQLSVDADVFAPIDPVSWYLGVQQGEFIGTIPSLGIMNLEPRIVDIVERRKSQFTAIGKTLTHFPIWNCFRYLSSPDAWVVDPNIMVDVIHPNVNGFGLWGKLVGGKFNDLGFPTSNFSIANQSIPAPPVVEEPAPINPPTPPSNEDTAKLIALCFYFHICK